MNNKIKISVVNLNQSAMDFTRNLQNIKKSILLAKSEGSKLRVGSELEITGYSCEDHFLEIDTYNHSWECLAEIIESDLTQNIICSIGMPIIHKGSFYNCSLFIYNKKIILIKPKKILCDDGNYREGRYFTPWIKDKQIEDYPLPKIISEINDQYKTIIGDAIISALDVKIGCETCEELWSPKSPHIDMSLQGVHIFCNSSGSHHQLRKLNKRIELIENVTKKSGGAYLYSNQIGCDGNRLYFDGSCLISFNDSFLAQGPQFSVKNVDIYSSIIDIDEIDGYRGKIKSRGMQSILSLKYPEILISEYLCQTKLKISLPIKIKYHDPMEEIALGPAIWLWDYLKKSKLGGFFIPLSGGADSSSTAIIVYSMCKILFDNYEIIKEELQNVIREKDFIPDNPRDICSKLLHSCYMGTENNSEETKKRANILAKSIGSNHAEIKIDGVTKELTKIFNETFEKTPKFKTDGGSITENLALQNIQARSRMVLAYMFSQLIPWINSKNGGLLVLGSSNVDEALRGYYTKYDCSSADLNPIGSISKVDLKKFLIWASNKFEIPILDEIVNSPPTAELEPISNDYIQNDEDDMGFTYPELSLLGMLRKEKHLGPVGMFNYLSQNDWKNRDKNYISEKVKKFFFYYAINRHKMTTLTPSYHAENYSPDDNRFDLRPFLYNCNWTHQFKIIDEMLKYL